MRRAAVVIPMIASLLASTAGAQAIGAALGGWSTTGARPADDPARGLRLSGIYDRPWHATARWRVEGAFVQAGFTRDFPTRPNRHVTENSLEFGAHLMSRPIGTTQIRAFAGPVVAVGIGCGTDGENDSNGRISCSDFGLGNSGELRLGAALGAHSELGESRRLTLDFRAQVNTIGAARGRGPALSVAIGLRVPR